MHLKAVTNLLLAMFCISIMDTMIKMLSGGYALHQLVFIRAAISLMILTACLVSPWDHGDAYPPPWRTYFSWIVAGHGQHDVISQVLPVYR